MANDARSTGAGLGASLLRREDERHLLGSGEFVPDIKLPGTMEVAFVRGARRARQARRRGQRNPDHPAPRHGSHNKDRALTTRRAASLAVPPDSPTGQQDR